MCWSVSLKDHLVLHGGVTFRENELHADIFYILIYIIMRSFFLTFWRFKVTMASHQFF